MGKKYDQLDLDERIVLPRLHEAGANRQSRTNSPGDSLFKGLRAKSKDLPACIFMDILIIYCLYSYQWEFIPI